MAALTLFDMFPDAKMIDPLAPPALASAPAQQAKAQPMARQVFENFIDKEAKYLYPNEQNPRAKITPAEFASLGRRFRDEELPTFPFEKGQNVTLVYKARQAKFDSFLSRQLGAMTPPSAQAESTPIYDTYQMALRSITDFGQSAGVLTQAASTGAVGSSLLSIAPTTAPKPMDFTLLIPIVMFASIAYSIRALADAYARRCIVKSNGSAELVRTLTEGDTTRRRYASLHWGSTLIALALGFGLVELVDANHSTPGVIGLLLGTIGLGNLAYYVLERRLKNIVV